MIDWETFELLIDEPSSENREILEEFIADAKMRIDRLPALQNDFPSAAGELHQLKGTSANFGFDAFREQVFTYEQAAKHLEPLNLTEAATNLSQLLQSSIELVKARGTGYLA